MDKTSTKLLLTHLVNEGKLVTVWMPEKGPSGVILNGYLQERTNNRYDLTFGHIIASFWADDDITFIDLENRSVHIGFMPKGWYNQCGCWLCELMARQEEEYQEASK